MLGLIVIRSNELTHVSAIHMPSDAATTTTVAQGFAPHAGARTPGTRSSRAARGGRARWERRDGLGSEIVPSRSIFGARLRSRVPQYGHSVMYGETSAPQFLQT